MDDKDFGTIGAEQDRELHPLPSAPRCRGIRLGDGHYRGCAYGDGNFTHLTGPCDCPVCEGSGLEGVLATIIPHSSFGDPDCCGCLNGVSRGDLADIVCNECGVVLRTVPADRRKEILTEMELSLETAAAICPHCKAVNRFPGLSRIMAFTCRKCGTACQLSGQAETVPETSYLWMRNQ